MKKLIGILSVSALLLVYEGCRKPYNPPAISSPGSYLVVEGVIDPGPDSTIITLSQTVNLSASVTLSPVTGATVAVLSDQNTAYPLTDEGNGNYISPNLNLDQTHQYRLKITTSDGTQYQSDLEAVLVTPPIDSVGYNIVTQPDTGLQLFVNAHDPTNTIHYFRWTYGENWEFFSKYFSGFITNGTELVQRTASQLVSQCYSADTSTDIPLATTAGLTKDVLYQSPLLFIPNNSERIEDRYRLVVRQYALSGDAYNFWRILKTNSEQLGSIFDAQPSQVPGNIHCLTNPAQPVIGYISVSTSSNKTLFIYSRNLPNWVPAYPYTCYLDTAKDGLITALIEGAPTILPVYGPIGPGWYTYTSTPCADCTNRGTVYTTAFLAMSYERKL